MLNINNTKATCFKVENKGNYVSCNLSTGKKNQDGTWSNCNWNCRMVGKCKDKATMLNDKDKITITSGIVENSYDKEKQKGYTNVIVFDFTTETTNSKTEYVPVDDNEDFSDLPF